MTASGQASSPMKNDFKALFVGLWVAAFLSLTFVAFAQENSAAAAPGTMRRLDSPEAAAPADRSSGQGAPPAAQVAAPDSHKAPQAPDDDDSGSRHVRTRRRSSGQGNDRVAVFGNIHVGAEERVHGDAVAVFGGLSIDGQVEGDAVGVFGDVTLGPDSRIEGDVICVGGTIHRAPGSVIVGQIVNPAFGSGIRIPGRRMPSWMHGVHFYLFLLFFNLLIVLLYSGVAALFPNGIRKCGEALVQRPLASIVSAFLTVLLFPVLFILLLVTVIGIPIALIVLPVGLVGLAMFGKASFYGLVGKVISKDRWQPPLAVLVGGLICLVVFMIPFAGLAIACVLSFLGLGSAITALFLARKGGAPAAGFAAAAAAAAPSTASAGAFGGLASDIPPPVAPLEAPPAPSWSEPVPPPLSAAAISPQVAASLGVQTLPRAGFWIRTGALAIDGILVVLVLFWKGPFILPILAVYGAVLWKLRGSTIGGIILGLTVVRLDGRPVDWGTAWVRALACFFSLAVIGLGFIWVAFDPEKQSWHDKIAGTTVVRSPKGVSLI